MAYVTVPKDLTKIKSKVMFNLTKRQLICFSAAVAIGLPLFFLVKDSVGTTTAALCMVLAMLPMFLLAMYEKNGQPLEVIIRQFVEVKFLRPKERPYQTNNFYAALDEKQYRAVKKMTRAACANNDCGNCLLLDDGETCVCVQSISYSLLCRYFREAVLPADRQLCEQITRSGETDLKRCAVCGSTFAAGSNRAKYCPDCAAKIRRRQKAQSERNRRLRIKTTT